MEGILVLIRGPRCMEILGWGGRGTDFGCSQQETALLPPLPPAAIPGTPHPCKSLLPDGPGHKAASVGKLSRRGAQVSISQPERAGLVETHSDGAPHCRPPLPASMPSWLSLFPPRLAPATQILCASRTSLVVQWLRFHAARAGDLASIPDWELRSHMPCGVCQKLKRKRKQMLCVSESHSQMLLVRPPSSLPVVCLPAPPTGAHSLTLPYGAK